MNVACAVLQPSASRERLKLAVNACSQQLNCNREVFAIVYMFTVSIWFGLLLWLQQLHISNSSSIQRHNKGIRYCDPKPLDVGRAGLSCGAQACNQL